MSLVFDRLNIDDEKGIIEMSQMATAILREHYDPIIGVEQNTYMLNMFQSVDAIKGQLDHGYRYYFVRDEGRDLGFIAFFPRDNAMYLSKLYLYKSERGRGISHKIIDFVSDEARKENLSSIELNVNRGNETVNIYKKLGFRIIRDEKNDIGNGFYMDDHVFALDV